MSCLSPELAVDFVAGALPDGPAGEVEAHMARCHECRRLIVEIAKEQHDTDIEQPRFQAVTPPPQVAAAKRGAHTAAQGEPSVELRRGTQVGRYTLLYPLGEGGMGSVHAAFDPKLDRRVALKFLRTDLLGKPQQGHRERLVREARALARLSHPNVVSIYDVAETAGSVFLAMELIDGSNARVWRELGHRSQESIVSIYRNALQALVAAHDQGIIHRDFKPDNVMVGADGIARVTDFGLARAAMVDVSEILAGAAGADWETLTQTGLVLGTPRYMAPEQFRGVADERSDQFALCLSLYESLYGHYPFGTKTARTLDPSRPLSDQMLAPLNKSRVPDALRRALLRGMAIDPSDRYPSLGELDYDLRTAMAPAPSSGRWWAMGAVAALVATATVVLAPDAPPTSIPLVTQDYEAELRALREQISEQRATDEELSRSQKRISELERLLSEKEREIALRDIAEVESEIEAGRHHSLIAPPPLPDRSVERSVTTRVSEVLACYDTAVTNDDELMVSVRVGISKEGRVRWVAPPMQGDRNANSCLERALRRLTFPSGDAETTATLRLSFFRLESGLLALNMRASTRTASLGQVTVDAKGRILVDCTPDDPLCGL